MYSYHDCYKILAIESTSDWAGVRKAYKQKIQKWHPDRITDSIKKSSAEDKLKELNLAYEQIYTYYKKHGCLPPQDNPSEVIEDKIESKPSRSRPYSKPIPEADSSYRSDDTPAPHLTRPGKLLPLVIFTVIGLSFYILLDTDKPDAHSTQKLDSPAPENRTFSASRNTDNNSKNNTMTTIDDTLSLSADNEMSQLEEDRYKEMVEYFTIGTSVGEVLRIQGPPDLVVDNTWFYGESSIEFEDGVVKDWKRNANHPLKAHIDL